MRMFWQHPVVTQVYVNDFGTPCACLLMFIYSVVVNGNVCPLNESATLNKRDTFYSIMDKQKHRVQNIIFEIKRQINMFILIQKHWKISVYSVNYIQKIKQKRPYP